MKQIEFNLTITDYYEVNDFYMVHVKKWVNQIAYFGRKQYGCLWFKQMLNQMEIKEVVENYTCSNLIQFLIDGKVVMEQNEKHGNFYVDYDVWCMFESQFGYNALEIQNLIKYQTENHFGLKVFTPTIFSGGY